MDLFHIAARIVTSSGDNSIPNISDNMQGIINELVGHGFDARTLHDHSYTNNSGSYEFRYYISAPEEYFIDVGLIINDTRYPDVPFLLFEPDGPSTSICFYNTTHKINYPISIHDLVSALESITTIRAVSSSARLFGKAILNYVDGHLPYPSIKEGMEK